VSAQIITALRKRADALEAEAGQMQEAEASDQAGADGSQILLKFLAEEFRALADQAEAR
jgi:hypothetical protein